jgi:hypothetical protein
VRPLWVESGGAARSPLKRLCPLKRTSRPAATGTPISCILIRLTYRIHKPLFSFAEKTVPYLTLCRTVAHLIQATEEPYYFRASDVVHFP